MFVFCFYADMSFHLKMCLTRFQALSYVIQNSKKSIIFVSIWQHTGKQIFKHDCCLYSVVHIIRIYCTNSSSVHFNHFQTVWIDARMSIFMNFIYSCFVEVKLYLEIRMWEKTGLFAVNSGQREIWVTDWVWIIEFCMKGIHEQKNCEREKKAYKVRSTLIMSWAIK